MNISRFLKYLSIFLDSKKPRNVILSEIPSSIESSLRAFSSGPSPIIKNLKLKFNLGIIFRNSNKPFSFESLQTVPMCSFLFLFFFF